MKSFLTALLLLLVVSVKGQVGEHRNDLAVGVNAGYVLNSIGFVPKVTQTMHGGMTAGISARYVCEKYFSTICSVAAEVNYTSLGWKEKILDPQDQPVINPVTGAAETYSRNIGYIQIPVFAHLAWGRENKGFQFFFQAGPQFGLYLSESTDSNFNWDERNTTDRSNKTDEQGTMPVENKFDYGIAGGLGMEYSHPRAGHFQLEARYYYGLGNIYGDSKRDFFGRSNHGSIVIKVAYLFDIMKTKK